MKLTVGLCLVAYYTWWVLLLVILLIIIVKLLTQRNFQVGITSGNSTQRPEQFTLEPILVRKKGRAALNQDMGSDN